MKCVLDVPDPHIRPAHQDANDVEPVAILGTAVAVDPNLSGFR
jgi:hypothetical protein